MDEESDLTSADGAGWLYLGPCRNASLVEDVHIRTAKRDDLLVLHEGLEADCAIAALLQGLLGHLPRLRQVDFHLLLATPVHHGHQQKQRQQHHDHQDHRYPRLQDDLEDYVELQDSPLETGQWLLDDQHHTENEQAEGEYLY